MSEQDTTTDVNPLDTIDFSDESESTVEPTTPEASSAEENKEEATPKEETEDKEEPDAPAEDEEEKPVDETTEEESKPKNSANNRIRSLANENRELKQTIEQLNAQHYKAQTAEELQEGGMDATEARIEALNQERILDKANAHITALNSDLNMEAVQVTHDFPVFDPDSDKFDPEFAAEVRDQWIAASGLTTDPNTNLITQARVLPYDFYKTFAKARERGEKQGQIRGKRDYEKTANATDITPIASPKNDTSDPLMDALLAD